MRPTFLISIVLGCLLLPGTAGRLHAQGADPIGLDALRTAHPELTGSGVVVAQTEAIFTGSNDYQANPGSSGLAPSQFTYIGTSGAVATGVFPNAVGTESPHADSVSIAFYGASGGVSPGVSHVYNYEANYFVNHVVVNQISTPASIVNQSFVADNTDPNLDGTIDSYYDNYTARYGTLFISGAGNGGQVFSPSTAYNSISVAAYGGASSTGTAYDGRSKPDITAPASATSFSTPLVAGAAAILKQAAALNDGGASTASDAADGRTIKALLLNGAVKPSDWTHTATAPLDTRYGAGILNVDNSFQNLAGGEHRATASNSGSLSAINTGNLQPDQGWNFASISNGGSFLNYTDGFNHYLFDLSSGSATSFTLTTTLTWWRQSNQSGINNLDLILLDAATGVTISISDSAVDNVEQIFASGLAPGRYDLVVRKDGSSFGSVVSQSEIYALAYHFVGVPEPGPAALVLLGGLPILGLLRRRR